MRLALVLGIVAYTFFFIMEALYPAAATSWMAQTFRGVMIVTLAVLLYMMWAHLEWMLPRLVLVGGPALLLIMVATASLIRTYPADNYRAAWSVMGSVMFATFIVYGLSRFPLKAAAVICITGACVLLYLSPDHVASPTWLSRMAAQLALANITGALMMTIAERRERSLFLQTMRVNEAGEKLAESAREAAEASEMKSRLLAGVSHDMRQPMTGLAAHTSVLARAPNDMSIDDVRRRGESMETILLAMDEQLNKLVDIARTRSDLTIGHLDRIDIRGVLDRVATVYQEHAKQAQVRLKVRKPLAARAFVYSKEDVLFESLSQLVFNAIKYSRGRDNARVVIGTRREAETTHIVVYDNGVGILPENLNRVFQPYFLVNTAESVKYQGRGLGLAQAQSLVSSLPGHALTVKSVAGRGSCFSIVAPQAAPMSATAAPATISRMANQNKGDIGKLRDAYALVVDNDVTIATALAELLESMGVLVDCRTSFSAGLLAIETAERDYDVIVVDYKLDDEHTGLQLIEHLNKTLVSPPPTILISGDVSTIRAMEPLPYGTRYLPKPVIGARMLDALTELLPARRSNGDADAMGTGPRGPAAPLAA